MECKKLISEKAPLRRHPRSVPQEPACVQARCLLGGKEYVGACWLVLLSACFLSASVGLGEETNTW